MNLKELTDFLIADEKKLRQTDEKKRSQKPGRLSVRERLDHLLDVGEPFFEMGIFAGYEMYSEWGGCKAAGVITGIGKVKNHSCMIIANDPSVKAGAFFPQSVKKVLRAQRVAFECRIPILYLVDSSGVFLPLQDEIFPDEDDFGRIFRNNAVLSSAKIPQIAAIMGNCIAGGGYLPVLCDQLLMTEGSGLYLAGPALVKAAIGQVVDSEELGGAKMHAEISGTVDYLAKDDADCLSQMRHLVSLQPFNEMIIEKTSPKKPEKEIYLNFKDSGYDVRDILDSILDADSWLEYKKDYGKTLVAGFAKIGGIAVGVVANQRQSVKNGKGEIEIGGVIYADSADKAARFIMECNQMQIPILFFQDVMGFMVGKEAESSGIIRSGAKLVNAISNSVVPKITCIIGSSFGAGHYALCGKAYDPNFILAWPNAKYAVMGADQAQSTLQSIQKDDLHQATYDTYLKKTNIRYGAARGWIDAIIAPDQTRKILIKLIALAKRNPKTEQTFHTGVIQT